jgi:ferredoxin--NADP+ reductase/benzoate/toluate 1,2-dioxygenase reductase subunit
MIEISRRLAGRGPRPARIHTVIHVRNLSPSAFVLRFTREGLQFQPGQWINLGMPDSREQREYSIYSGVNDDFLEVLVKEIPDGIVSRALRRCVPGDPLEVEGPNGAFTLVEGTRDPPRFLFCATGTGISPFHCFARSKSGMDYQLLHGIRTGVETYEHQSYDEARLIPCVSQGAGTEGYHPGRLTSYLKDHPVTPNAYCYLCGNSDMIYEAYSILKKYGITRSRIYAEVYF